MFAVNKLFSRVTAQSGCTRVQRCLTRLPRASWHGLPTDDALGVAPLFEYKTATPGNRARMVPATALHLLGITDTSLGFTWIPHACGTFCKPSIPGARRISACSERTDVEIVIPSTHTRLNTSVSPSDGSFGLDV